MSWRLLPLLLCLAGAGCGMSDRSLSYRAPSDTELGECQRQADDDPAVKTLLLQPFNSNTVTNTNADPIYAQDLRRARINATNACLRARGMKLPGGVEPVNKSGFLL